MKYKTFRALVLGGVAVVGIGLGWALRGCSSDDAKPPRRAPQHAQKRPPQGNPTPSTPSSAGPTVPADPDALRPLDRAILARVDRGISGSKLKDALKGRPWKVNLYHDAGKPGVNRLKIDLDRDGRWDESWTLEGAGATRKVKRKVSPADDGQYTAEYRLRRDRWAFKDARTPAPQPSRPAPRPTAPAPRPTAPPPARPKGHPLRALDRDVLAALDRGISGKKKKDAFPNASFKASLYQDGSFVNRVKLDLDRDGKWDEKWTIERPGGRRKVKRKVAPNDDEQYTVEYRLREGVWVEK